MLTLPIVQACRQHLQADEVVVLASAASARLAAGRSVVDRWICPESVGLYRLFCRDLELEPALAETIGNASWILNLMTGSSSCVHERLAEMIAGELVSIDPRPTQRTREMRRHITQQWAADIRESGWQIGEPQPARIQPLSPVTQQKHAAFRILVHPGSGGPAKCWPLARFMELVTSLSTADVTWMIGPAEAEAARALQDRDEPILFESDLTKAADQMVGCDVYVGNDGGMTHLAAALGLATVAIFGTTDPHIWRPLGEQVTVVAPDEPRSSMKAVLLNEVRQAVVAVVTSAGSRTEDVAR